MTQGVGGEPEEVGSTAEMSFGRSGQLMPIYLKIAEGDGGGQCKGYKENECFPSFHA